MISEQKDSSQNHVNRRTFIKQGFSLFGAALLTPSFSNAIANHFFSPTPDVSDFTFSSAIDTASAIRKGLFSSEELTKHILTRIDKYNPTLNAIVTLLKNEAIEQAQAADKMRAKGEWLGPLHGVPITIKDAFEIAGVRTTAGAPFLSNYRPKENAVVVTRLQKAGAVILGHTNVPFMLGDHQSFNDIFGRTNNPWNLERTPGGSTGGGAAALAAGLSYLSLGSDIGGSIRVPAHFCGVYGHKPTLNVVPQRGHIPPPPGTPPQPPAYLPVAGPLARKASDLRMVLEIVGGPDDEDAIAYRWSLPPERKKRLSDYRIGYILDDPNCPVSSDVKVVLQTTIGKLRNAGLTLEEGWPEGVDPLKQYHTYLFLLNSVSASDLKDDQFEEMHEQAKKQDGSNTAIRAWAWTAPHKYFQAASSDRMTARAIWQRYFQTHDVFLLPTAFVSAFPHDPKPWPERTLHTPEGSRKFDDMLFWISFATLTGNPATTAPIGITREGLPVGIQILGPYLEDATPIDVADKMAEVTGGFKPPEGYL